MITRANLAVAPGATFTPPADSLARLAMNDVSRARSVAPEYTSAPAPIFATFRVTVVFASSVAFAL